ncbi:hypothetical protein PoB_001620300 [Plakobranchus ocellatus]|uniref:Uncharacterized protein n=1 Tax=Plakobranchus ocellatus TaxID=259542 RepID=A0AAV3Z4X1_9GAST|nr:hypothetical protein PoB_001620300 [Plakobranchus ocellatus]
MDEVRNVLAAETALIVLDVGNQLPFWRRFKHKETKLANERERLQRPDSQESDNGNAYDSQVKLQQAMFKRQELLDRIKAEQFNDSDRRPRTYTPRRRYTPSPLPPPSRRSLPDISNTKHYHFGYAGGSHPAFPQGYSRRVSQVTPLGAATILRQGMGKSPSVGAYIRTRNNSSSAKRRNTDIDNRNHGNDSNYPWRPAMIIPRHSIVLEEDSEDIDSYVSLSPKQETVLKRVPDSRRRRDTRLPSRIGTSGSDPVLDSLQRKVSGSRSEGATQYYNFTGIPHNTLGDFSVHVFPPADNSQDYLPWDKEYPPNSDYILNFSQPQQQTHQKYLLRPSTYAHISPRRSPTERRERYFRPVTRDKGTGTNNFCVLEITAVCSYGGGSSPVSP